MKGNKLDHSEKVDGSEADVSSTQDIVCSAVNYAASVLVKSTSNNSKSDPQTNMLQNHRKSLCNDPNYLNDSSCSKASTHCSRCSTPISSQSQELEQGSLYPTKTATDVNKTFQSCNSSPQSLRLSQTSRFPVRQTFDPGFSQITSKTIVDETNARRFNSTYIQSRKTREGTSEPCVDYVMTKNVSSTSAGRNFHSNNDTLCLASRANMNDRRSESSDTVCQNKKVVDLQEKCKFNNYTLHYNLKVASEINAFHPHMKGNINNMLPSNSQRRDDNTISNDNFDINAQIDEYLDDFIDLTGVPDHQPDPHPPVKKLNNVEEVSGPTSRSNAAYLYRDQGYSRSSRMNKKTDVSSLNSYSESSLNHQSFKIKSPLKRNLLSANSGTISSTGYDTQILNRTNSQRCDTTRVSEYIDHRNNASNQSQNTYSENILEERKCSNNSNSEEEKNRQPVRISPEGLISESSDSCGINKHKSWEKLKPLFLPLNKLEGSPRSEKDTVKCNEFNLSNIDKEKVNEVKVPNKSAITDGEKRPGKS